MSLSKIVICADLNLAKQKILSTINSKSIKLFEVDELKIDDAKAITREAYIAEVSEKFIIIIASSFRIESQNALLKLLEEPPRNIVFIILTKSKTLLLPTIRSRMVMEYIRADKEECLLGIDIKKMELKDIFEFLQEKKMVDKALLRATIEELLLETVKNGIKLSSEDLDTFEKALVLANLNSRPQNLLTPLMLMIYRAKGRR